MLDNLLYIEQISRAFQANEAESVSCIEYCKKPLSDLINLVWEAVKCFFAFIICYTPSPTKENINPLAVQTVSITGNSDHKVSSTFFATANIETVPLSTNLNGSAPLLQSFPSSLSSIDHNDVPISRLNWRNRPVEVQEKIDSAFRRLQCQNESQWEMYNGDREYNLCGISEQALAKVLIQKANTEHRDIYFLDIGAGNFQWITWLAFLIETQIEIDPDVKVHLIGVRGETCKEEEIVKTSKCIVYRLGNFKVEELSTEFQKRNILIENQVDLIVSRWCFRHLVDSVGTFVQAYDLLRAKTGLLLMDGFLFLHENETRDNLSFGEANGRMVQLLCDTKAPFLMQANNSGRSLDHFFLKKPNTLPCALPMKYSDMTNRNGSASIARFEVNSRKIDLKEINWPTEFSYHGDKELYEWLQDQAILDKEMLDDPSAIKWEPILSAPTLDLSNSEIKPDELYKSLQIRRNLQKLIIKNCKYLDQLPSLAHNYRLEMLHLEGCPLKVLTDLSEVEYLKQLILKDCVFLEEFPDLSKLLQLEKLDLSGCTLIFPDLSFLKDSLKELNIKGCRLQDVEFLQKQLPKTQILF